jgi:hypothetical protein
MIKAAIIGLGRWGQTVLRTLLNNAIITPIGRAAVGQTPYPIALEDMIGNVRTLEAIQRSVTSGTIETI